MGQVNNFIYCIFTTKAGADAEYQDSVENSVPVILLRSESALKHSKDTLTALRAICQGCYLVQSLVSILYWFPFVA